MKNLIKKTIVMLLVVCSLVSAVGVQPVFARENLPSENNKKKINKSNIPVIERVWANDKVTYISVKMPSKLMKKYKMASSYRVLIEKRVNGKWKKVKTQKVLYSNNKNGDSDVYGHYGKIGRAIFGFSQEKRVGEQYRYSVRLYTKNNKKELTRYSKSYKIKVKKNNYKQLQHPNDLRYNIQLWSSVKDTLEAKNYTYNSLLLEESLNAEFSSVRRDIVYIFSLNVSRETLYESDTWMGWPITKGKYYRVYSVEFNKNGTLTYYPHGDTYFFDGEKLVNVINPGQDILPPSTDDTVTQ